MTKHSFLGQGQESLKSLPSISEDLLSQTSRSRGKISAVHGQQPTVAKVVDVGVGGGRSSNHSRPLTGASVSGGFSFQNVTSKVNQQGFIPSQSSQQNDPAVNKRSFTHLLRRVP